MHRESPIAADAVGSICAQRGMFLSVVCNALPSGHGGCGAGSPSHHPLEKDGGPYLMSVVGWGLC